VQRLQPAQDLVAAVQQGVVAHAAEYGLFVGAVFNERLIQGLETFLEMIVILVLDDYRQGMQQTGQFFMLVGQVADLIVRIARLLLEERIQHHVFHPHVQIEFVNECVEPLHRLFPFPDTRGDIAGLQRRLVLVVVVNHPIGGNTLLSISGTIASCV
jgi:hypothetical protein